MAFDRRSEQRISDVVLRVERDAQNERARRGTGPVINVPEVAVVRVTSTSPTEGRYPGQVLDANVNQNPAVYTDLSACWCLHPDGAAPAVGRYAARLSGVRESDGLLIYLLTGPLGEADSGAAFSGARVYSTVEVNTGNSGTYYQPIEYDESRFDTDGYWELGANPTRLTAPADGYYLIGGHVQCNTSTGAVWNADATLTIFRNGTEAIADQNIAPCTVDPDPDASVMTLFYLEEGDYVELWFGRENGSGTFDYKLENLDAYSQEFWITRVGGAAEGGGGVTDHGALTGLAGDDHTQYPLLAGRAGGQEVHGDTASGGNLILDSTAHGTKGAVRLAQSNPLEMHLMAAPAAATAGFVRFYADTTTGELYKVNAAGVSGPAVSAALDINGLSDADPALDDYAPVYDTSASGNRKAKAERLLGLLRVAPGGRLTLTSGTPVTTADASGGTLYYTPYESDVIVLWDGTRWVPVRFPETSLLLSASSGTVYDVFGYLSSGLLNLELLAWSGATARATAVTVQDGRYCKLGDKTRLLLGTLRASGSNACADSAATRYLWNAYHRRPRRVYAHDSTDSWTYSTTSYRSWNNSTANRVEWVDGLGEDPVWLDFRGMASNSGGNVSGLGVGIDSTTANSADLMTGDASTGAIGGEMCVYHGWPGQGYHYGQMLERGADAGTTTFYGDVGKAFMKSALSGWVWG